mgnify:CR=1 FL=1
MSNEPLIENHSKFSIHLRKRIRKINMPVTTNSDLIKNLAKKCLRFKWIEDQTKNLARLLSPCPFCQDIHHRQVGCNECHVHPKLCDADGKEGLIGYLQKKYGNIELCDMESHDYRFVRNILINIAKTGLISPSIKKKLQKVIKD